MNNCIALTKVRAFLYRKVFHHFAVKLLCSYICYAVYFDFVKVIFRLTPKLR